MAAEKGEDVIVNPWQGSGRRAAAALCLVIMAGCAQPPSQAQSPRPRQTPRPPQASAAVATPDKLATQNIYPGGPPAGILSLQAPQWGYRVKNRYPHDPEAFTQGLLVGPDGYLYESTGQYGSSEVRRVEIKSGKVLQRTKLNPKHFGEGLAHLGDRLVQLTWQSGEALVYDCKTLGSKKSWRYEGEGWGLTEHEGRLLMSDGSSKLSWRDPKDFHEVAKFEVTDGGQPVTQLNELEWIDGEIWANVWQSNYLAVIQPQDGKVKAWVDMSGLMSPAQARRADVLNGIAFDPKGHRIFVTGKLWPVLFEIEITH